MHFQVKVVPVAGARQAKHPIDRCVENAVAVLADEEHMLIIDAVSLLV